ncbi:MAG: T9SS type A sorting domain-containing protein [Bacteroidota bacterium]
MVYLKRNFTLLLLSLLSLLLFSPVKSSAQGWELLPAESDHAAAVTISADGHYVVCGRSFTGMGIDTSQEVFLMKMDALGNILWTQVMGGGSNPERLLTTADGGFLVAANISNRVRLIKTDANGLVQWSKDYTAGSPQIDLNYIIESQSGGYIFTGETRSQNNTNLLLVKVALNGDTLWTKKYHWARTDYGTALTETPQNEILVAGLTNGGGGDHDNLIIKTTADGELIWKQAYPSLSTGYYIHSQPNGEIVTFSTVGSQMNRYDAEGVLLSSTSIAVGAFTFLYDAHTTADGGWIVTGFGLRSPQRPANVVVMIKVDRAGTVEWFRFHGEDDLSNGAEIIPTLDNGYMIAGQRTINNNRRAYIIKTDSLGYIYTNLISGKVALDTNMTCQPDNGEPTLANVIVEARKPNRSFYGSTDSSGCYLIDADTGSYEIILHPPSAYWMPCADSLSVTLSNFYDTTVVDFALQADIECPFMTVDLATPFLRRCFANTYSVNYCNYGTLAADSAYIDIKLDPYLHFDTSSISAQMLGADTWRFQLGQVDVSECGTFTFDVTVDCDSTVLGQTHCVEAHIYPDSLCLPPSSEWSGAFIEVEASCQDSLLNFTIQNTGSGDMNDPLRYVIIEDAILLRTAPFDLVSGASEDIPLPNNGSTYLLYAQQEPGAPGNSLPILSIEGCVGEPGLPFSTGFVNQFPQNDGSPFVEIDCRQNDGSYDPNDKQGFPTGSGPDHLIEANTDLEYLIRFQNTGTDTAFRVVIKDTLSPWLDPASIQLGVASHPYRFELRKGGLLEFTFDNIMLPDSNVNLAASNGFIKFRIAQRLDNPIGTRIENQAAIFFDFNPPIFTNTTFHTIGKDWIDIILDSEDPQTLKATTIKIYPNPMSESARIEWSGEAVQEGQFELYTLAGQMIRADHFSGTQYEFTREGLAAGLYFFSIKNQGIIMAKGKIIIH